jgi:hypothetical protein
MDANILLMIIIKAELHQLEPIFRELTARIDFGNTWLTTVIVSNATHRFSLSENSHQFDVNNSLHRTEAYKYHPHQYVSFHTVAIRT